MSGTTISTATRLPRSFTHKKIDVTFEVYSGGLGPNSASDTAVLSGYRCTVDIDSAGLAMGTSLSLRIEGLSLALMNRMSVLESLVSPSGQTLVPLGNNTVSVQAGDDTNGMATIFYGTVTAAFADFSGAPNVAFHIVAYGNTEIALDVAAPISFASPTPAATIYSIIADQAGLNLINHGVRATVPNFYGWGTRLKQLESLRVQSKTYYDLNRAAGTLSIWSSASAAASGQTNVPLISSATGLVGYPAYSQSGVRFTSLFNPNIVFNGQVRLKSDYAPAAWVKNQSEQVTDMPSDGTWTVSRLSHNLTSELTGGPWFTMVEAYRTDIGSGTVT